MASVFLSLFLFAQNHTLSAPKAKSDGTEIAKTKTNTGSSAEQDTLMSKSGIEKAYHNGSDEFEIWVFVKERQSISKLAIFNMLGKEMVSQRQSDAQASEEIQGNGTRYIFRIPVSRYTAGMYLVAVEGTDFKDVERFVKSR